MTLEVLDVDSIGDQTPLTPEEEKALSDFFQQKKAERAAELARKRTKGKGKGSSV